jgi:hypothetical protein
MTATVFELSTGKKMRKRRRAPLPTTSPTAATDAEIERQYSARKLDEIEAMFRKATRTLASPAARRISPEKIMGLHSYARSICGWIELLTDD